MAKPPKPLKPLERKKHTSRGTRKRQRMTKVAIISRKEQPFSITLREETKVFRTSTGTALFAPVVSVPRLERMSFELKSVSSSWISHIGYIRSSRIATMVLINGYIYHFKIPFKLFEAWYYAASKGTFFNYRIKDKYPYRRIR